LLIVSAAAVGSCRLLLWLEEMGANSQDCFKQLATGVVSTTHQERLEACTVRPENSSNQVLMNVFDDL
jgi:hypothetical protein